MFFWLYACIVSIYKLNKWQLKRTKEHRPQLVNMVNKFIPLLQIIYVFLEINC